MKATRISIDPRGCLKQLSIKIIPANKPGLFYLYDLVLSLSLRRIRISGTKTGAELLLTRSPKLRTGTELGARTELRTKLLTRTELLTWSKLLTALLPNAIPVLETASVLLHTTNHRGIRLTPLTPVVLPPFLLLLISLPHLILAEALEIKDMRLHHELRVHLVPLSHHTELTFVILTVLF